MDEAQAAAPPSRSARPVGVIIVTVGLVFTAVAAYLVGADALLATRSGGRVPCSARPAT